METSFGPINEPVSTKFKWTIKTVNEALAAR